jgi:hypothetical protein
MQIPFAAFAEDCTLAGEIDLRADRLSDFLATTSEFELGSAAFRALDDGRIVQAESAEILRDDLCIVVATGPRGLDDRRVWTRQHPVRAQVGPYVVLGYLHTAPTIDPLHCTEHRPIVALTDTVIEYTEAGAAVRVASPTVLVNCTKIHTLENVSNEDVGLARQLGALVPAVPQPAVPQPAVPQPAVPQPAI